MRVHAACASAHKPCWAGIDSDDDDVNELLASFASMHTHGHEQALRGPSEGSKGGKDGKGGKGKSKDKIPKGHKRAVVSTAAETILQKIARSEMRTMKSARLQDL